MSAPKKSTEKRLTDAFADLVHTGKLLDTVKQIVPILSYQARKSVYRVVRDRQYVALPTGDLVSVTLAVELLPGAEKADDVERAAG